MKMYLPANALGGASKKNEKVDILSFFGYDQRDKIDDRQLSEMYNICLLYTSDAADD